MAPSLPVLQGIESCIYYMEINPNKPICNTYNYYDGSNVIRITWSENQVEEYITQSCLECNQDVDNALIINIRWSVLGIIPRGSR